MKRENLIRVLSLAALVVGAIPTPTRAMSIVNSKHDLSANGPGTIKAATETEVCKFCHTPHRAGADLPLWNHQTSSATYTPYSSTTMIAQVGQPNGSSKLCLSCHDGTVALGMINSSSTPIAMQNGVTTMPVTSTAYVGTDLSQDHPVSFTYDSALASAAGDLVDPSTLTGKVRLDSSSRMQCTSCHDPHDNQNGNFLVLAPSGSNLCTTCHISAPSGGAHTMSTAQIVPAAATALTSQVSNTAAMSRAAAIPKAAASKQKSAKTVASNGCSNCHTPHAAGSRKRLLLQTKEEQTCFACHNGTVGRKNLEAEFNKRSVHPVLQTSRLHEPGEDLINGPRHVACADCHNSHAAKATSEHMAAMKTPTASAPAASGPIQQVKGLSRSGSVVKAVSYEYELCFRCHADSISRKPATVNRVNPETNTRQQFNPGNRSFHPVVALGKNRTVPSLISPYVAGGTIQCTDCHNNDQGPGAGGTGPSGPHGSAYAPLLERRLDTVDPTVESAASYALCYKCHSRDSILSDQSFTAMASSGKDRGHRFHIVDQKTACTTCHDSHGTANNAHLINFNPDYVRQASNGRIEYKSTGFQSGSCTLTCHGYNHLNTTYPQASLLAAPKIAPRRR